MSILLLELNFQKYKKWIYITPRKIYTKYFRQIQ